jgi:hypothetical protein
MVLRHTGQIFLSDFWKVPRKDEDFSLCHCTPSGSGAHSLSLVGTRTLLMIKMIRV